MTDSIQIEARTANSRFAKAGVSCFYENEVLNSSFVHLMKFCAKKSPPSQSGKPLGKMLRKAKHIWF